MVKKTAVQKKTEDTPVETPPVSTTTTEDSTKKVSKRVSRKSTEPVVAAPATENQVVTLMITHTLKKRYGSRDIIAIIFSWIFD